MLKRAAGTKNSGIAHSRPRRDPRPRRLVPLRGACRHPLRPGPGPLTCRTTGSRRSGAWRSSDRRVRSVARRSTCLRRMPEAFRVVALAGGPQHDAPCRAGAPAEAVGRRRSRGCAAIGPRPAIRNGTAPRRRRVGGAGDPRGRRPRRRRNGRHRQPAAGRRRAGGRQGRRDGQQGDARRRRPPRDAAGSRPGRPRGRAIGRPTRTRVRWPGSARSTRSTRRSGNASSARPWPASRPSC